MKHIFNLFKKIISIPKKFLIPAILILIIAGFFIFRPQNSSSQRLEFASVKKQDIASTVSSSGSLTGKNVSDLKFQSGGKLAYINVKVGDKVFAGEVVAGLDTQDLAIKLQQAQNTYRDKQATAQKIEDDVKDHSSDESFAQRATRTSAQAARDSAFDAVKEAERAFQDDTIVSPIDGVITESSVIPGQVVGASDVIAKVVDFSKFRFDTDIDEVDIGKVSVGQKAKVSLDAFPNKTFEGVVEEIIPQTKTTSQGATVITVKIDLDNQAISPVNGLSGQASIILAEAKDVFVIPLEALRDDNTVVIPTNQGLRSQKVTPGIKSDTDVEIKEGLKETDRVVLNPPSNLNVGARSQNPLNNVVRFLNGGRGGTGGGSFGGGNRGGFNQTNGGR